MRDMYDPGTLELPLTPAAHRLPAAPSIVAVPLSVIPSRDGRQGRSSLWSITNRARTDAKVPPAEHRTIAERQLDMLWGYLAETRRDRSVALSEQLRRDAAAGMKPAKHALYSGVLNTPTTAVERKAAASLPAPITLTPRQLEALRRSAEAHARVARDVASGLINPASRELRRQPRQQMIRP